MIGDFMLDFLFVVLSALWPENDAIALTSTAPGCLTVEKAKKHLAASYIASLKYGIDQDLILSIAYYESSYRSRMVTKEPRGKVSCGVMTPIPTKNMDVCRHHNSSLLNGYMAGTKHLKWWLTTCKNNKKCALLGYNGGFALINTCKAGPYYRTKGRKQIDVCKNNEVRVRRARTINRTRKVFSGV